MLKDSKHALGLRMPILGAFFVLLVQLSFAYHALKTGRPFWWILVIMGLPLIGCAIYYFFEVLREERSVAEVAQALEEADPPDAELQRRANALERCASIDNKIALAEECTRLGRHEEAIRLFESCLQGAFWSDGTVLYGLLHAAVEGGRWDSAAIALERLRAAAPRLHPNEVRLLEARVLEGRGETEAALDAYRALLAGFVGLEARCRYGQLLARLGQLDAAHRMFDEVLIHARRFPGISASEARWVLAARQAIGQS